MAKVRNNFRIYSDLDCDVFLAPLGTTLPTTLDDPGVGFEEVGWLGEDGVPVGREVDVEKYKAYQGGTTLRVKITSDEKTFTFEAMEEKPLVSALYWGHGDAVITGVGDEAIATVDVPEAAPVAQRAAVLRFKDDGITKLYLCENVQVTPNGEVAHSTDGGTTYGFNAEIIGGFKMITDAPSFTAQP